MTVTENDSVPISISIPIWLKREFTDRYPKSKRSEVVVRLLMKEMGLK